MKGVWGQEVSTETVDWHGEGVEKEGSYGHRWFSLGRNRDVSFGASVAPRPWGSEGAPVGPCGLRSREGLWGSA